MVLERIANPWSCIRLVGSTPTLCVLPTCPSGKGSGLENRLSEMACGFESYRWRYLKEVFMGEAILNIREAVQKEVERAVKLDMAIKDSGNRREFESGAVRDVDDSKGNCTLLPLEEAANFLDSDVIGYIQEFKESGDIEDLYASIRVFNKKHGWSDAESMLELSKHFADGMKKYGKDNWKKGIPISSYMDSGIRHYLKVLAGWTDENHCRAFVWNLMCAIWTMNNKPELDDFTDKGCQE